MLFVHQNNMPVIQIRLAAFALALSFIFATTLSAFQISLQPRSIPNKETFSIVA